MAGLGIGLAVGLGSPSAGGGGGPAVVNPNLLTKTEQHDDAAWVKTGAIVVANVGLDPLGSLTADQVTFTSASGTIAQVSGVVVATGSASRSATPSASWLRWSLTCAFNSGTYTYSAWLMDPTGMGYVVSQRMDVSGGFVRAYFRDLGDNAAFLIWGEKLEAGAVATGTASTYGAVS